MNKWNKRLAAVVCMMGFLTLLLYTGKKTTLGTMGGEVFAKKGYCVVIDPGHGGDDPGKIGINGEKEKEVNLQIAKKVKEYLEANDVKVVMTREDDVGLYDRQAANKKVQDMKKRIALMEETKPEAVVSIHQNSYPQEEIHGAQMFYYKSSKEGQKLAALLQDSFVVRVDAENKRQIKANDSYYLLKKTTLPMVIVECGFLSNQEEATKLCSDDYQDRVAWAISMGILQYLNEL